MSPIVPRRVGVKAQSPEEDGKPAAGGGGAIVEFVAEVGFADGANDFAAAEALDFSLTYFDGSIGGWSPEAGPVVAGGEASVCGEEELAALGAAVDAGVGGVRVDSKLFEAMEEGGHS